MRLVVAREQVPKLDIMAAGTSPGGAGEGLSCFGNQDGTRIGTLRSVSADATLMCVSREWACANASSA